MEIRLVNESAGVVGHVEIVHNRKTDMWDVTPYFDNLGEATATPISSESESWARQHADDLVSEMKKECEDDFRKRYGQEPVGVMSETGFTIQYVEDE